MASAAWLEYTSAGVSTGITWADGLSNHRAIKERSGKKGLEVNPVLPECEQRDGEQANAWYGVPPPVICNVI